MAVIELEARMLSPRERKFHEFMLRWFGWSMAGAISGMQLAMDDYERGVMELWKMVVAQRKARLGSGTHGR